MHIHANQVNPNAQLDALSSAEKATAKAAAERTRRKLMGSASEISGEAAAEAYIVQVESEEESQERPTRQHRRLIRTNQKQETDDSENTDHFVSDWA